MRGEPTTYDEALARQGFWGCGEKLKVVQGYKNIQMRPNFDVHIPSATPDLVHTTGDEAEATMLWAELRGRHRLIVGVPPDATAALSRLALGRLIIFLMAEIRRNGDRRRHARAQEELLGAATVGEPYVREKPTIVIVGFAPGDEHHDVPANQVVKLGARRMGEWLVGSAVFANFGGIDTDQPHVATVHQNQGITVYHMLDLDRQRDARPCRWRLLRCTVWRQ